MGILMIQNWGKDPIACESLCGLVKMLPASLFLPFPETLGQLVHRADLRVLSSKPFSLCSLDPLLHHCHQLQLKHSLSWFTSNTSPRKATLASAKLIVGDLKEDSPGKHPAPCLSANKHVKQHNH